MKKKKLLKGILLICLAFINVLNTYSQTEIPAERRDLVNSLTPAERLTLRNAIIAYLQNTTIITAIADHDAHFDDVHGANSFLSWHRTYIQGLETYLAANGFPQFVPLPKWNPSTNIPSEFWGTGSVAFPAQYTPPSNNNPGATGAETGNWDRQINSGPELRRFCGGGSCPDAAGANSDPDGDGDEFTDFRACLEDFHDDVHGIVGTETTTPTTFSTEFSPAVALFWPWHAWIDDVYEQYRCICNNADNNHDYFGPNEEWDAFDNIVVFPFGSDRTFSAFRNLTTSGSVIVPSDEDITFRAGSSIELNPGFATEDGATFTAYIDACPRLGNQTFKIVVPDSTNNTTASNSVVANNINLNNDVLSENKSKDIQKPLFIKIIPNPSSDGFFRILSPQTEIANVDVYNVLGEIVYSATQQQLTNSTINLSPHPKGIYFIKVQSGNKVYNGKIILQ